MAQNDPHRRSGSAADGNHHVYHENGKRYEHWYLRRFYLLQNTLNSTSSEIISTYVYKMGLVSSQYSLSAAIGLFNNIINLITSSGSQLHFQ